MYKAEENISIELGKIKKGIMLVIEKIKSKLQEKGVVVTNCKVAFDGKICRITIKTPKGTRFERFGVATFNEDEEAAMVRNFLIKSFVQKLISLN